MSISERLKERRAHLLLTQQEVADRAGVNRRRVSHFECGLHNPNVEHLCALADALRCTTDYLLGRQTETQAMVDESFEMWRHWCAVDITEDDEHWADFSNRAIELVARWNANPEVKS